MKNSIILSAVGALVLGIGIGYFMGSGGNDNAVTLKEHQAAVDMMTEQTATMQKMGTMMSTAGAMMKTMGEKYNEQEAVSKGKDLEAMGSQYMGMKHMMGN